MLTPFKSDKTLSTMKILCDSREKKFDHIKAWFATHDIDYEIRKLDIGDYMIDGKDRITVDRKRNLQEICHNLTNPSDKSRFWKEVRRSRDRGVKLVVLIEHGGKIKSIQDVAKWNDKYSGVSGRSLMKEMYRVHVSYGVDFLFCDKRSTGKRILEILQKN